MSTALQRKLISLRDEGTAAFIRSLTPGPESDSILGIRMPELRKLAKEIVASGEYEDLLNQALPHRYFEENQLHAIILSEMKDYERCISEVERFSPYINNWGTCDTLRPRCFAKHHSEVLQHVYHWMESPHEYTVRLGIGTLERFFLGEHFHPEQLQRVTNIKREEYYIKMMQAWYLATALAKQPKEAMEAMRSQEMDGWVWRKAIQKTRESFRVKEEIKRELQEISAQRK